MLKRITLLAMAVGALVAFAVPAMASAEVTNESGLQVNTVTAESSNTVTQTSLGPLVCERVHLHITLSENSTTARGSGNGEASGCVADGIFPIEITSIEVENIEGSGGTGTAAFAFNYNLLGGACRIAGSTSVSYTPNTSSLHIAGGPLAGSGGGFCPSEATGIEGDFALSEAEGAKGPVFIS